MDVFQGWYKVGTEGTYDYRPFSALCMILRIVLSYAYSTLLVSRRYDIFRALFGLLYAFLGIIFLTFKLYKVNWMNYSDGNIFLLLAFFILSYGLRIRVLYYIGIISGLSVALVVSICFLYKFLRKFVS